MGDHDGARAGSRLMGRLTGGPRHTKVTGRGGGGGGGHGLPDPDCPRGPQPVPQDASDAGGRGRCLHGPPCGRVGGGERAPGTAGAGEGEGAPRWCLELRRWPGAPCGLLGMRGGGQTPSMGAYSLHPGQNAVEGEPPCSRRPPPRPPSHPHRPPHPHMAAAVRGGAAAASRAVGGFEGGRGGRGGCQAGGTGRAGARRAGRRSPYHVLCASVQPSYPHIPYETTRAAPGSLHAALPARPPRCCRWRGRQRRWDAGRAPSRGEGPDAAAGGGWRRHQLLPRDPAAGIRDPAAGIRGAMVEEG
jgi:hypothetical protein